MFRLEEFVSEEVFDKYGAKAWRMIDGRAVETISMLRQNLDSPITINNWLWGGQFSSRGYREPGSSYYSPTSQHAYGRALDFDVKGMAPREVIVHILESLEEEDPYTAHDYKDITFIEIDVNWVHIGFGIQEDNKEGEKLLLWSPTRGYVSIKDYLEES